jgi:mannose-6-phosphate isomerase-like protein (cupin superfamily)
MSGKVNLAAKLATFDDRWKPRIVADYNDNKIVLVKVEGEFVWHSHDDTDDLFLVLDGHVTIELEGRDDVELGPGELFVVPRGVRHRPVAAEEAHVLLIEKRDTVNTGDAGGELTAEARRI